MNNILNLIKGEIIRLVKYRIIFFGILVSLIWILIVAFQTPEQAKGLIPLLVVTDSGMMAIILIGAGFYYEKQENTIKSVLVSPVSLSQVLISKIVSAVVMAFISVIVVVGSAIIIHGISVSIFELILYVLVVVISHTGLGYIVILKSPDFLAMLVKLSGLILIFYLPTLLVILKIIPENLEIFALLSPTYSGELLIKSTMNQTDLLTKLLALGYLSVLGIGIYWLIVYPKFKQYAIQG